MKIEYWYTKDEQEIEYKDPWHDYENFIVKGGLKDYEEHKENEVQAHRKRL